MILTGKAKEEFFNWLDNQGVNGIDISNWEFEKFQLLSNVSQNALIIEWFDSVGIYINTPPFYDKFLKYNRGFESIVIDENKNIIYEIDNENDVFNFRQEAIKKAIKKANEIYNEKYSI